MSWYCQQIGGNETSVGHDDGYVGIANYQDITEDIKDECKWEDHGESFGQYYAKQFDDVWFATREEIATWYLENHESHIPTA